MKAIEQYFHVVLFITMYKVVLTFKSVDETLLSDPSSESSYWNIFYVLLYIMPCNVVQLNHQKRYWFRVRNINIHNESQLNHSTS